MADGSTLVRCLITFIDDHRDHFECATCDARFYVDRGVVPHMCPACKRTVRAADYG